MGTDQPRLPTIEALNTDPETRLEFLVETGVLEIDDDDQVTATIGFEDTRSIYADTYSDGQLPEEQFVETVADLFDLSVEAARAEIEAEDVSRHEVITYLSLQSHIDRELPQETLAILTGMAAEVGVGSPVPDYMDELTDETYEPYLASGDVAVFVWKYPCDPCRQMKGELPPLLEQLPASISIAGIDGESAPSFRSTYDIDTAPVILLFADGSVQKTHEGYTPPLLVANSLESVYDGVSVDVADEG